MNMDTVMIGSFMPLVPGMAITNAVRDTLRGDYLSGGARVMGSFLKSTWDCNWNWYWAGALHKDFLAGRRAKNEQYGF